MATNIFIFVPAFGQMLSVPTFLTTHALRQELTQKGIGGGIASLSFPDIAELRSMATTIWYDTLKDCSHILFIDADMAFPPQHVIDMLLFNEPLVGTIYRHRQEKVTWVGSGTGKPEAERRGNFMLVEGVGMGCTLISRVVIDKMVEKFPELIDTRLKLHPAGETLKAAGCERMLRFWEKMDIADRGLVSEDLSFCIRWNQCGGQTWGAIGHPISHVGMYDYRGRFLDWAEGKVAEGAQAAQAMAAPVQPLNPDQIAAISQEMANSGQPLAQEQASAA